MSGVVLGTALVVGTLLLFNGKIWTGDASRRFVEAVAVEGNRIVAVGTSADVTASVAGNAERIDLQGRLVVPGFIDNHVHFVDGGFELSRVQLRDAASPEEFARRIADFAAKAGKNAWVTGGEWDEQLWKPYTLPTRQMIDAVTTPISLYERLVNASIEKSFGSDRLRIGGLKGFADGSLGSSTAWFSEPFLGEPSNRGLPMEPMTNGSMKRWVKDADAHNLQVAIHAIGDRANDEVLKIFESLPRGRRFRIEHAQHLTPDLIKRFAFDQVIASMQPYHAIDDGRWAETKIGHERARSTYAFRSLIDAGATLTFGSDWTVAPLNPILGIYAAVTRRTIDGKNPNGWIPEQKITVEEALRSYTVNNAFAMYRENDLGRIAPGMLADMAVLSNDLFTIPPEKIENVTVDMTIFDGTVIYTSPRP